MLKRLTAACLLSFAGLGAAAQLPDSADMSAGGEFRRRIDRHTSTKAYRMLFVGTPLIVGGVVMQAYDSDFRRLRNGYSRSFRHDYDDWLQYAPAGAMVALKACGVRGRSSWGRMLVSDAFSAGLMAIGVNSLKYSCRVMRPDGSSRNSLPLGAYGDGASWPPRCSTRSTATAARGTASGATPWRRSRASPVSSTTGTG